jgi:ribonuclease T2
MNARLSMGCLRTGHGRRILAILAAVCFWVLPSWAQETPSPRSYTLALTWQATFCAGRSNDDACAALDSGDWSAQHFALHGLWPNVDRNHDDRLNADDNYCLADSERGRALESAWSDLPEPEMSATTATALARVMPGAANGLDRYQWVKHGTCSGLDPERYFAAAIARTEDVARTSFNRFVADHVGEVVERRDLIEAFEMDFGKGSGRALRLFCKRPDDIAILMEIRLALRVGRIAEKLTRGSLVIPPTPASGTCPTKLRIEAVP